jgi:hypothetical protein
VNVTATVICGNLSACFAVDRKRFRG